MAATATDVENDLNKSGPTKQPDDNEYKLKIFQSTLNFIVHITIGATVFVTLMFAFRFGLPIGTTSLHITLCVIGYQLLMAQATLALSPNNSWTANLKLVHKRRIHFVLQIVGSGMAIAGSFIMSMEKTVNWNTLHGRFALVALVFTVASLVNGCASLYAFELRKCVPGILSKLTHICFGIVAFAAASIALIYGFDKNSFKNWATIPVTNTLIAFTSIFTFIIIVDPFITFYRKSKSVFSR